MTAPCPRFAGQAWTASFGFCSSPAAQRSEVSSAYQPAVDDYLAQALRQTTVVLRAGGDPTTISQAVRAKLTHLDSTLPIFDVRTYDRVVKDDTEVRRFTASLLGVFASVALFLAIIGIYGVPRTRQPLCNGASVR
jgi:hypothetical protein